MSDTTKRLRDEAANLHMQARAILDEFAGKDLPKDKAEQVDKLYDDFEAKIAAAEREERSEKAADYVERPDTRLPFYGDAGRGEDGRSRNAQGKGARQGHGEQDGRKTVDPAKAAQQALARKAFNRALLSGNHLLSAEERKALQVDQDDLGGFMVTPEQTAAEFIQALDDLVYIRGLATLVPVTQAESLGVPTMESDVDDADWTSEVATGDEDDGFAAGKRALFPHPLAKLVKISRTLLRRSTWPVEQLIMGRLAYKHGVAQEKGFLSGTGSGQPLGVFTASDAGISTGRDTRAASATALIGDDFINVKFALKMQYQNDPKCRWIFNRTILKAVRKLKTGDGQYLWQAGLGGQPSTLLDVPYLVSEFAPGALTASTYVAVIGSWRFYWIAEALKLEVQVLDQLYARTNQMGYIGRTEVDGMPVLEEAFARLQMAAS